MPTLNLQSLISMGVQAMQMLGKSNNIVSIASKAAQVWKEYQKYPQTPEGLKQVMAAYNLDSSTIQNALNNLNPQVKSFINQKLPGSIALLENLSNEQHKSSSDIQNLLQKAKRR